MNRYYAYFRLRGFFEDILFKLGKKSISYGTDPPWYKMMQCAFQNACRTMENEIIDYNGWIHGWLMYADRNKMKVEDRGVIEVTYGPITGVEGHYFIDWNIESNVIILKSRKVD